MGETISEAEEEGIIREEGTTDDIDTSSSPTVAAAAAAEVAVPTLAAETPITATVSTDDAAAVAERVEADLARAELLLAQEEEKYDLIFGDNYDEDQKEYDASNNNLNLNIGDYTTTGMLVNGNSSTTTRMEYTLNDSNTNDEHHTKVGGGGGGGGDKIDDDDGGDSMSSGDFINDGFQRWQEARDVWCGKGNITTDSTSAGDNSLPRQAVNIDVDEIIDILFDPRWRGGGLPTVAPPTPPPPTTPVRLEQQADTNPTSPTSPASMAHTEQQQRQQPTSQAPLLSPQQQLHRNHLPPRFPYNIPLPQMIDVLVDLWEAEGLDV